MGLFKVVRTDVQEMTYAQKLEALQDELDEIDRGHWVHSAAPGCLHPTYSPEFRRIQIQDAMRKLRGY